MESTAQWESCQMEFKMHGTLSPFLTPTFKSTYSVSHIVNSIIKTCRADASSCGHIYKVNANQFNSVPTGHVVVDLGKLKKLQGENIKLSCQIESPQ